MSVENITQDENTLPTSIGVKMFERMCNVMGLISVVLIMFVPLYLIFYYRGYISDLRGVDPKKTAQAGVGVAVLLRATSRRLIRTGASNVMRTTFATFFRATSRTFTRKMVRIVVHSLFGVLAKDAIATARGEVAEDKEEKVQAPLYALLMGFVALAFSFWGVLYVVSEKSAETALQAGKISVLEASLAAAIPVLLFGIFTYCYSRKFGVKVKYNTAIDGLILQAYFTAAGSFLPMTTDVDYVGDKKKKMKAATATLLSMFGTHAILAFLGHQLESPLVNFTSALFLVYCFIYSFPIRPLEGHDVWSHSKLLWFLIWIPILASFTLNETMKTLTDLL